MAPAPPVGFPGCARCPYRDGRSPVTCRRCVRVATGRLRGPGCPVCARPGPTRRCCPNPWCGRPDRGFGTVFPVGLHRGGLRRAIAAYKYREQRWWAEVFGALLAAHLRAHPLWFEEYDLLVPMPAYAGPGARRDWDPVGRMFDGLAAAVGDDWEAGAGALVKSRETPALTGRSRPDRLALADRYLAPALSVPDPARVAGRRILVVDDVLTEGSSLRAAATRLREAGALEVAGLVLARRAPR